DKDDHLQRKEHRQMNESRARKDKRHSLKRFHDKAEKQSSLGEQDQRKAEDCEAQQKVAIRVRDEFTHREGQAVLGVGVAAPFLAIPVDSSILVNPLMYLMPGLWYLALLLLSILLTVVVVGAETVIGGRLCWLHEKRKDDHVNPLAILLLA